MTALRLLTWLDVKRLIARQTRNGTQVPQGIIRINCFSSALEIGINEKKTNQEDASKIVKEWFGDWYQEETQTIQLDFGDSVLPVEFFEEDTTSQPNRTIRPFWDEIVYLQEDKQQEDSISSNINYPKPYTPPPSLIAFYSFKGGVGRSLHLAAHVLALIERAKEINQAINILIIDADLEAPGLTYWQAHESQTPSLSFIDFLEVCHYNSEPTVFDRILELLTQEIKKSVKDEGKSNIYFLPAFYNEEQLLDTPILPENLVRSPEGSWFFGDAIYKLGQALSVDYILIDLRAGVSEISSPILFDPRIERFLVTTLNEQSVHGISLVLKQISNIAPQEEDVNDEKYYDPSIIISMLIQELKSLSSFEKALVKFQSSYVQSKDEYPSMRLQIQETYFAQELLYVNSWGDAKQKLSSTSIMSIARKWAKEKLSDELSVLDDKITQNTELSGSEVRKLRETCDKYEYAESGEGNDLLITDPIKNLANNFSYKLPCVVSIGAKGAGKTFNYIQLSRLKFWGIFKKVIGKTTDNQNKTYIFPMLQSSNLQTKAKNITESAREELKEMLDNHKVFSPSDCVDRIKEKINSKSCSEPDWANFWIIEISRVLGLDLASKESLSINAINQYLKDKNLKIIILFDGLEDIFSDVAVNECQKVALKALISNIPNKITEIRDLNLGIIIFLRRDFLRHTIIQNSNQFEHLYRSYDLVWNRDSFLKLVFWLCIQSQVIGAEQDDLENFTNEQLKEHLEKLWGKKLGTDKSKEAYSDLWVFDALTDFNGKLQARDIVRFVYHAADISVNQAKEVQFEKWSTTRLLPPQAIRRALKPCSDKKVKEAKEEYPAFKEWVDKILPKYSEKKIPLDVTKYGIDSETLIILEQMGVIYEDNEKEEAERFYIPEIFREGLGFSVKAGRPRILALKRKVTAISQ